MCGCILFLLSLITPRIVILILFLFTQYLANAYETAIWPGLGFFFLPVTTLAYAFAINQAGAVDGLYLVLVVVAVLIDMGILGSGGAEARRRRG